MKRFFILLLIFMLSLSIYPNKHNIQFKDMFETGRLKSFSISSDGKFVVFSVKTANLDKNSFTSDIFYTDINGSFLKKLTDSKGKSNSPQFISNKVISFISTREGNPQLYKMNIFEPNKIEKVLNSSIPGGMGSYIWTPDKKSIAFQNDIYPCAKSLKESVEKEEKKKKSGIKVKVLNSLMFRVWNYWKDGKRSHVFLQNLTTEESKDLTPGNYDTPPLDLGGKQDFVFSRDMKFFAYVKNTDKMVAISTNNDIFLKDLFTGKEENITKDNRGNDMNPIFSPLVKYLAYLSMQREGFEADKKNIIIYDLKKRTRRNLTKNFKYNIKEIIFSPKGKYIYFNVDESVYHPIYKLNIRSGKIVKLINKVYSSNLAITRDGKHILFFNQTVKYPNEIFKFDVRKKRLIQLTNFNREALKDIKMNSIELFEFKGANNDTVEGILLKPPYFDENKKYPMVFLIHGGPQGCWTDDFHFRWNLSMFASPGYVVVAINFHGSRGYGQAFTDAVSKDWGGAPFIDLVKGQKYVVENYRFIDKDKIVAAGASYGGFMVNWIAGHYDEFKYPFKCLVSHDGIFDARSMYYSTEELWFDEWEHGGTPWENKDLYEKFSPSNFVAKFKIPMLIIHGEKDYRVPVSQGLMLFTALQRRGVKSKMLYFPDEDHFVRKPKNAQFWWKSVYAWFEEHIK